MKKINRILYSLMIVIGLFIFQQMASRLGRVIANIFSYESIDEFGIFAWISVHHIVQLIVTLIVIAILYKILNINFGFNIGNKKIGIKYAAIFTAVILIYVIVSYIIGYASNQIAPYNYPLNAKNVVCSLGFQLFLSGTSEEILFRALPITIMVFAFGESKKVKVLKYNISVEVISSAILFSIAHIKWAISPFTLSVDYFQLVYSLSLGIAYGITFQKTKSIIYPMIMHSMSNVLMVGIGYIFCYI